MTLSLQVLHLQAVNHDVVVLVQDIDSQVRHILPTMEFTMHDVLKFPLQSVRRSTKKKNKEFGGAEILFFTGIRYERHDTKDINKNLNSKKVIEKRK